MLELLRRKAQSPYIQATVVIIILVFIFWLPRLGRKNSATGVATVNGQPIPYQRFQRAYDQAVSLYRQRFGGNLPPKLLKALGLKQQVLQQLIQEELLRQAAQETDLRVSPQEVRAFIQQMPSFQENGRFNLERYQQLLSASRLNVADFEAQVRDDLLNRKLETMLNRFARVSEAELRERFAFAYDRFKVAYALFSPERFLDKVKITDQELKKFFTDHRDNYRTEPLVKLRYVRFAATGTANSKTTVSETRLREYYDQHRDEFHLPEQRHLRHILIRVPAKASKEVKLNKRKQAETILKLARSGKDFAELAKKYSEDGSAAQGGDLGFIRRGQTVPAFEKTAFSLKPGQISDIVETRFGFHLIKVEEVKPARTISFAKAKPEISRRLRREQERALAFKQANQAYERIITAGSLDKAAAGGGFTIHETGFFSRSQPPAELANSPEALEAAFRLKKGELSSLIESADSYFILYVADRKPPEVPSLDRVRSRVREDFRRQRARQLARQAAAEALKAIRQGKDFAKAARAAGGQPGKTGPFSRATQQASGLPSEVAEQAVRLSPARKLVDQPVASREGFYLVQLLERKPADQKVFNEKRKEILTRMQQEKGVEIRDAWLTFLRDRAEITVNQQLLQ